MTTYRLTDHLGFNEEFEADADEDDDGYEEQLRRVERHDEWLMTEGADHLFGEGTL